MGGCPQCNLTDLFANTLFLLVDDFKMSFEQQLANNKKAKLRVERYCH
jgi:hypothetical protein